MSDAIYSTTLYTGKTWERNGQKQTASGEPSSFSPTDALRAQIREAPDGPIVATVTATITDHALGTFRLLLTDEETATIPVAKQFGAFRTYWLDADIVKDPNTDGRILRLLSAKLAVMAGVTKAGEP